MFIPQPPPPPKIRCTSWRHVYFLFPENPIIFSLRPFFYRTGLIISPHQRFIHHHGATSAFLTFNPPHDLILSCSLKILTQLCTRVPLQCQNSYLILWHFKSQVPVQNRSKFGPKIRCKIIKDCELRWVQQRLHATDPTGWNPAEVGCKEIKWSLWILIFNCHRIHIFCCISEFSVPTVLIKIDGDTNRHCTTFDRHAKQREWTGRKIIIALLHHCTIVILQLQLCTGLQIKGLQPTWFKLHQTVQRNSLHSIALHKLQKIHIAPRSCYRCVWSATWNPPPPNRL